jgi:glyoxylase-like metal-dependent hydrolase (beta-lactamase superfamily II)
MRDFDLLHLGRERVICCWETGGVLVDPGPQSCEATLLDALGGDRPRALLLTHIHLDHAGISGTLVRRWPDLPVYVHELGAPHMADPGKLVVSVARLLGEENMRTLWGDVVPVPEKNLHVLRGGETVIDGAFRVEYTPGHAAHHVSYLHEPSGTALVGDVAGIRIPPSDFTLAPTPPPDIDVEAWHASIDLVADWEPNALAITHFGLHDDAGALLDAAHEELAILAEAARTLDAEAFLARFEADVKARAGGAEAAEAYLQAVPGDLQHPGLARYWSKLGEQRRG